MLYVRARGAPKRFGNFIFLREDGSLAWFAANHRAKVLPACFRADSLASLTPAARVLPEPRHPTQLHIVKAGALPSLVRLTALGREKLDVSRYCGMTLSNLACHRQNRVPVVQAGGLKPLCDMAFDGERLEMQRAAGLALYNLSCAAANQVRCRCYRVDEKRCW